MAAVKKENLKTANPWGEKELRAKVGELFIVGFDGHAANEDVKTLITTHKVGAIILFQRNVSNASQLLDLTNSLQEIAKSAGHAHGLFIAIDQENGLVTRINPPIANQLPGSMTLGATCNATNAFTVAELTAKTLKACGINMNYAPVADINSEPKNPVIGVRSFSDDPETVGRFVSAQIKGLQQNGILPCVKHWCGHGDTVTDSHHGLPIITKAKAELEACEFIPFRRAVVEGVDAIMTAHISMPNLGGSDEGSTANLPASLNPNVIKILRHDMKYDGLIVSDCLEMEGVRATYGTEKGAVMALKAGTDCLMVCHTLEAQVGAIDEVVNAVKSGEISQEIIEIATNRMLKLKSKYLGADVSKPGTFQLDLLNDESKKVASEIYAQSTTVVRGVPGFLPFKRAENSPLSVVLVSPAQSHLGGGAVDSGEEHAAQSEVVDSNINSLENYCDDVFHIQFHDTSPFSDEYTKRISDADLVILATRNANISPSQREVGLLLGEKLGHKLITIATCDPYDFLVDTELIKNYITIYEPTIPALKAAIDVIFGVKKAEGVLPVCLPKTSHIIRPLMASDEDDKKVWDMWNQIFPEWPIEFSRLSQYLRMGNGHHFLHNEGFCLAYLTGGIGTISCVGVMPNYRSTGIGTALIRRAKAELMKSTEISSLSIGSLIPRFWPGVPHEFSQEDKDFFLHRGFHKSTEPTVRDLFCDISTTINIKDDILQRVAKLPYSFAPMSPDTAAECIARQEAIAFHGGGWTKAYEGLASRDQHHEVLIAFSSSGEQIGWTLMCSASSAMSELFAFLPIMPSGTNTGLIACVGVDQAFRGKGIGLGLVVNAMRNMKMRGVEGICVDWTDIRGFYEKLGFEAWKEYDSYEW